MMNCVEYKTTLDLFLDALGGKWKLLILWQIRNGPKRPSVLRKSLLGLVTGSVFFAVVSLRLSRMLSDLYALLISTDRRWILQIGP